MKQHIQNFGFEEHLVRLVDKNGEPWFVGKDVCNVLDIVKHHQALSRLDSDERGTCIIGTPSGDQTMILVSVPGVFRLIFSSRKPEAERFKRWLAHEVLPQIRKTGRYLPTNSEGQSAKNDNLPERTPAPIDARARLFAEAAEIRLTFGPREAQNYLLENGLPDPRIQRMPRNEAAYACLRNLLNAPVAGRRLVDHMRQVFNEGRRREALAVLRSLKINFTGDGFDIPNVLPKEIADWFENTRWERPFEYLRSLSDALPFQKRGGRYSHSYTHIPSSFLDEA